MLRILLRCDYLSVLPKLKEKLEKSGFLPVEDGEDAALFVPQLARCGWEREVLACTARGGAVVIVKKENIPQPFFMNQDIIICHGRKHGTPSKQDFIRRFQRYIFDFCYILKTQPLLRIVFGKIKHG